MKPRPTFRILAALISASIGLAAAVPAEAGSIRFCVDVDTSDIKGKSGLLDFQFNPGPLGSQAATATVSMFESTGALLAPTSIAHGGGSGVLPGDLTLNNTVGGVPSQLNEVIQDVSYGTGFDFLVTLTGPAVDSPSGKGSGTTFAFGLYDSNFVPLLTTDPSGAVFTIDLNPNGTAVFTNFPKDTNGGAPVATTCPEPSPVTLLTIGLFGLGGAHHWIRRRGRG
jgi:hypothetical protein